MAYLIKCPTCQKEVSSDAKRCPHCGRNIESYRKMRRYNAPHEAAMSKAAGILCLVLVGALIAACAYVGFAACCTIAASFAQEMHEIAGRISPEHYDGHYQTSFAVFTAISVILWLGLVLLTVLLIPKLVAFSKKQIAIIQEEKRLLMSEEHL